MKRIDRHLINVHGDVLSKEDQQILKDFYRVLYFYQNDVEHEGWTPGGKRKRPMSAGVVLGDIENRVSDILPDPSPFPSDASESRKKFIKGLCTFRGGVSPQVVEAMKLFYNIQSNVSRKDVDIKLREAGHFLEEKEVTTMYNKIKSAFNNHLK